MFHTLFQITVKQFPTAKSTFPLTKAPSPVTSGGVRLRPLGFAPDTYTYEVIRAVATAPEKTLDGQIFIF